MTVDENCDIKGFVTKNGIEFKKGRGFYELTKAHTTCKLARILDDCDKLIESLFTRLLVHRSLNQVYNITELVKRQINTT